jgi:replicative DNA helicase
MAESIFNKDAEKVVLARLLVNPAIRPELRIDANDFSPEVNRVVMSALDSCIASGIEVNIHSVTDRLNSLGVKLGGVLEPGIYLNSLTLLNVDDSTAVERAKEIWRCSFRRKLVAIGKGITALAEDDKPTKDGHVLKAQEMLDQATQIFNANVSLIEGVSDNEARDLFNVEGFLDRETTFDRRSLVSPFAIYHDLYGTFDPGNIYAWIARMKVGKSSYAMSLFLQMAMMPENAGMQALVLDTEMETEEVQSRIIASLSGVREFYIRHKLYDTPKYKHLKPAVEAVRAKLRPLWNKVHHVYIGGWSLEAQISYTRRWAHKHLRDGARGIIALDYFKLNSSGDFQSRTSRDILIGAKVDAFKNLVKSELHIPMIAFAQANREGEDSKQGGRMSNSSVVGGSDMITQFCSNIYLLERLSAEDRAALNQTTPDSATHSLKLIAPRQQGPNENGYDCLVKYQESVQGRKPVDRWCENYILLSFHNFVFREVGTFKDLYERACAMGISAAVQPDVKPRGEML